MRPTIFVPRASAFSAAALVSGAALATLSTLAGGCDKPQSGTGPAASSSAALTPSAALTNNAAAAGSGSGAATIGTTAPAPATPRADGTLDVTLLITADENGHITPNDAVPPRGGAAETLAKWIAEDHHCVGQGERCVASSTLALSTGDHFAGPAISTYFSGESTAETMGAMGYQASAFGNHELDFGDAAFTTFVTTSGIRHTAANMTPKKGSALDGKVLPSLSYTRNDVRIATVGLAGVNTAKSSMANRFEGVTFGAYEAALATAIPNVWKDGADVVVVLAHECADVLEPVIAKHPEWHVSVVAGAHCAKEVMATVGATKIVSCGRHFEQFCRVKVHVDKKKPAGERVLDVTATRVDVQGGVPDPTVKTIVEKWKAKLDTELSEEVGYTVKGFPKDSPDLSKLFLGAIRKQLNADVAVANRAGFRDGISAGPVTRATVYGTIPYENAVLIVSIPGEVLTKELARESAAFEGVAGSAKDGFTIGGKPVEPKKKYKVATLDFLYFGGDGFEFAKADSAPQETGMVWQTPVIDFFKKNKTTKTSPVEDLKK